MIPLESHGSKYFHRCQAAGFERENLLFTRAVNILKYQVLCVFLFFLLLLMSGVPHRTWDVLSSNHDQEKGPCSKLQLPRDAGLHVSGVMRSQRSLSPWRDFPQPPRRQHPVPPGSSSHATRRSRSFPLRLKTHLPPLLSTGTTMDPATRSPFRLHFSSSAPRTAASRSTTTGTSPSDPVSLHSHLPLSRSEVCV